MAMVVAKTAGNVGWCVKTVVHISETIELAKGNDELCFQIVERAGLLRTILEELQATGSATPSVEQAVKELEKKLEKCKNYLAQLDKRKLARFQDYLQSQSCRTQLSALCDELNTAIVILNLAVSSSSSVRQHELLEHFKREIPNIQQEIANPDAGVYSASSSIGCPSSTVTVTATAHFNTATQESFLVMEWVDYVGIMEGVRQYEVQYDEQKQRSICRDAKERSVKLGKPKVLPGNTYSVRVRKVNEAGPGPWSASVVTHVPACPPRRPPKPSICPTSPTQGTITVTRPTADEENGSPVTSLIVERCIPPTTVWIGEEFRIQRSPGPSITMDISLEPDAVVCYFCIRMKNDAGVSDPSEVVEIKPSCMIPGPPQNVQVMARENKQISLQWNEPAVNLQAVKQYEIQMRTKVKDWKPFVTTQQPSTVAMGLESGTKYWFRVCAINENSVKGEYSDDIETETQSKFSKAAHSVMTGVSGAVTPAMARGASLVPMSMRKKSVEVQKRFTAFVRRDGRAPDKTTEDN